MVEAVRLVGKLGGHLGRKRDGPPGTQTLWRGLQRLETATEAFAIFTDDGQYFQWRKQKNHGP